MRIFLGTVDIGGQLPDYASALRALGHDVTVGILEDCAPFYPRPDGIDIGAASRALSGVLKDRQLRKNWLPFSKFLPVILSHDLFVFQWAGTSLTYGNHDLSLLKRLGRKIIQICNGDDTRHARTFDRQYGTRLCELVPSYENDQLSRSLRNLRMAESHADLIVSRPSQASLALRPYLHFFYPLIISDYEFHLPENQVPLIVHAPTNRAVKGTDIICQAVRNLQARGISCEFRLLENLPNSEVRRNLRAADILIDQIHLADYGKLAAEAAASGCAVLVCNDEFNQPVPKNRPLVNITPENLEVHLESLIRDKSQRRKLAQDARGYTEQYHCHIKVCDQMLTALTSPSKVADFFYSPTFYRENRHLILQEPIPEELADLDEKIWRKFTPSHGLISQ